MDHAQATPRFLLTQYHFEDMHPRIGEHFQLEAHELPLQRHYGALLGYAVGQSVLVKTPFVAGLPMSYRDDQELTVRAFTGMGIFAFDSSVQRVCISPFHYLHLAYPDEVRGTQIRAAERVKVCMPTQVHRGDAVLPGLIRDIGVGGAMLECALDLQVGDTLRVYVSIALGQMQVKAGFEAQATVHRLLPGAREVLAPARQSYGLEFSELSLGQRILLQNYVYRGLLEDQQYLG